MKIYLLLIALLTVSCANKKDEGGKCTRLTVTNGSGAQTDIRVRTADNSKTEMFSAVSAGNSSGPRDISFSSYNAVQVDCPSTPAGCPAGTLNLSENMTNT